MRILGGSLAILGLCLPAGEFVPSSRGLGTRAAVEAAAREFEFSYIVRVPVLPRASRKLRLWIPLPETGAYQRVERLRVAAPVPYRIDRERQSGNRSAYLHVDASGVHAPFDIRVDFRVRRYERKTVLYGADLPPGAFPPDVARLLGPNRLIPAGGILAALSRQATEGADDPLGKARKIYDYVVNVMHYDHEGTGWGRGDAIYACTARHGNCTDFHSLFIGMARAAGIPAKFDIGFLLPPERHAGAIASYHCWAEFYLRGIGWIPVDAAEAWLWPSKRDYYFGALDPNRVRFTFGRDLRLHPPQAGPALNYFIYPYAELDGKPFGGLEYRFSFHDLPDAPPPS